MINLLMCIDNRSFIEKLFQDYIPIMLLLLFEFVLPISLIIFSILLIIDIIKDLITGKIKKELLKNLIKAAICLIIAILLYLTCKEISKWYAGTLTKSC